MEQIKITQSQIAKKLGVTQGAVSLWFLQINTPEVKHANAMQKHWGFPTQIWGDPKLFSSFMRKNSQKFGSLKILRKAKNGSAEV